MHVPLLGRQRQDVSSRSGWATYEDPASKEGRERGRNGGKGRKEKDSWRRNAGKGKMSVGWAVLTHLGVALKSAHLASCHRAIFLAITESLLQAHLDRVTGIFVSTIWGTITHL